MAKFEHLDYWKNKWKTGDTRFHQNQPHPQLVKYFTSVPKGKVMVPLCGKSHDLMWLKSLGHEVVGIELSSIACEAFFSENQLVFQKQEMSGITLYQADQISIWCGDFFKIPSDAWVGCTAVYDRAALIALPPDIRRQYSQHLIQSWNKIKIQSAQMLLITVEYSSSTDQGPPFSVLENEIHDLYSAAFKIEKLETRIDPTLSGREPKFKNVEVLESCYRFF